MPKTVGTGGPDKRKRRPLNMRTTDDLRERLERAAQWAERSLAQEVELRLELSLQQEDYLRRTWGSDIFEIADSLARSLYWIEQKSGKRWSEDDDTFELFSQTTLEVLRAYRERRQPAPMSASGTKEEEAKAFAQLGGVSAPRPGVVDHRHFQTEPNNTSSEPVERFDFVEVRPLPGGKDR